MKALRAILHNLSEITLILVKGGENRFGQVGVFARFVKFFTFETLFPRARGNNRTFGQQFFVKRA